MIKCVAKKIFNTLTIVLINVLLLVACQPHVHLPVDEKPISTTKLTPVTKPVKKAEEYDYRDSTLFFDEVRASLSMRATLKQGADNLLKNYKFQFRSRRDLPVKINNIAITVAGKRIVLEPGTLYLPKNKSLTFELSTADSQLIQNQSQATLLFDYERVTKVALIEGHKLVKFISD